VGLELLRQNYEANQSEPKTLSRVIPSNRTYRTYRSYLAVPALTPGSWPTFKSEILNLEFLIALHHPLLSNRGVRVRHQQTQPWIRFWREEQLRVDLFVKLVYV
jgi:hypothetical protein